MRRPPETNRTPADAERAFSAPEISRLELAQRAGERLTCPTCASPLDATRVHPEGSVSYVRRRLLVVCPRCHRHGALDVPRSRP